jgi:ABC-type molybdate transport system substrate-binding protein
MGDRVDSVEIDPAFNVVVEYPIAATSDDPNAGDFVEFVLSDDGRAILESWGFGPP